MSDGSDASPPVARRSFMPVAIGARRGGLAIACALAVVGVAFVWQSALLDLGTIGLPGAGFFPLVLGVALVLFASAIALEHLRERTEGKPVEFGHLDVLIVFAAMLAIPPLFEPLGAYGTLGLFGAALLVLIAKTRIWLAVASAAIGMVMCWYFFEVLLGLQLPAGPWEGIFGG